MKRFITAAAVTIGLLVGAVTLAAPSTAGAALAPQTAQDGAVQQFWQYMYGLENTQASCIAIKDVGGLAVGYGGDQNNPPVYVTIYGGSCLQSFLLVLDGAADAFKFNAPVN